MNYLELSADKRWLRVFFLGREMVAFNVEYIKRIIGEKS